MSLKDHGKHLPSCKWALCGHGEQVKAQPAEEMIWQFGGDCLWSSNHMTQAISLENNGQCLSHPIPWLAQTTVCDVTSKPKKQQL